MNYVLVHLVHTLVFGFFFFHVFPHPLALQFFWIAVSFVFLLKIENSRLFVRKMRNKQGCSSQKNSSRGIILDDLCMKSLYKNIFDVSISICICD